MERPQGDEAFELLARKIEPESRLLRVWTLTGGVSAQVTALEIELPGRSTRNVVVRRHGDVDLAQNPHIARDEFKLLGILQAAGVPAPAPCYLDESGEYLSTPCIVVEYIDGELPFDLSDRVDVSRQFAEHLSSIHHITAANADLSFLPEQKKIITEKLTNRPARLDESLEEGRIRAVLESLWPLPRRNEPVLLHGDYWPGNTIWKDGHLTGIIDWEDARVGDPLADLGISRLEMLWAFGMDAMHNFTAHYSSMNKIDFTDLPYWDLYAALRPAFKIAEWAGNEAAERRMREEHKVFLAQAFEKLTREL